MKDEAYEPLHDAHAKEAVDIILRLKGFYIKVLGVAWARARGGGGRVF